MEKIVEICELSLEERKAIGEKAEYPFEYRDIVKGNRSISVYGGKLEITLEQMNIAI